MAIFASIPKLDRGDRASVTSIEEKAGRQIYWINLLRFSSFEANMMRPLSAAAPGSLEGIEKGREEVHLEWRGGVRKEREVKAGGRGGVRKGEGTREM